MTEYRPFAAMNNLEFLGKIEGQADTTSEESIGTLSVPAGKLKDDDMIFAIIFSNPTGLASTIRIRATSNSVNLDLSDSIGSRAVCFLTLGQTPAIDDEGMGMFVGVRVNTNTFLNAAEADFNLANWITKAFTLEVLANGDATAGTNDIRAMFYKLQGSKKG